MVEFKQIPMGDFIVVEMATAPRDQRILLPDWARTLEGTVVAVGPKASECKVGDRVLFGAATGMESAYDGHPIRVMRDEDVDGVLE